MLVIGGEHFTDIVKAFGKYECHLSPQKMKAIDKWGNDNSWPQIESHLGKEPISNDNSFKYYEFARDNLLSGKNGFFTYDADCILAAVKEEKN